MHDQGLTPARLVLLQASFERALDRSPEQREAYLRSLEHDDADLARAVRSLLEAHARTTDPLERPVLAGTVPSPGSAPDRWIGSRVGAYEILRRIGYGGMGTVYEAQRADDQFRSRVAIKLLNQHAATPSIVQRFRRERQILANLRHPNIASLLDGGVTADGQPYFAMEYIEGEPITQWCDARSASITNRLELFLQVCAAVQYAHQGLVIHRDLKPANILVTGDGTVKLLDFGIARFMPGAIDDLDDAPLTRLGTRAYTPEYASPEQIVGAPVGTRADVYALGVVLFELLAGVRPFEMRGRTAAEIERIVTESDPPAPSQAMGEDRAIALGERSAARARSRVQGDLDAIVLEALRKEPERRYGSADELATDLQRHLDGRPVAARPDGWGYRLGKLVRRRRAETAAVALVLVSVVGGLAATALQATRAERERARAAEVTSFLTTMLGAADPASFGRDVQVREVLDSAVVRADALADRPAFEAEIRDIIGGTYLALGEFETAESQYRLALDALGRDATTDDRTIAMTLTHLSTALEFEGRYAAADTVLQAATAVWDRVGYSDDDTKGDHFDQRGRILVRLGRFPESLPFFEEALAIQKAVRPPNDSALAYAYANLGVVQSELGQNEAAETLMVAGVEAARRAHGEVHPLVASILSPLATVQARAGSNDDADATFLLAIEIRRKLLGEEHPDYAWTMFSYADFLMTVGRNAEAIDWSRKVLALRGRSLQDAHPAISTAMSIVGRSLGRMDSIAAGERWLRESLELRRTTLPPDHWIIASAEGILGEHLVLAGRFTEAESLLLGSERALLAARGEDAPVIQDARTRLVQLYEAWAKPAEAEAWRSKLARPD